jgi:hypothetical protein
MKILSENVTVRPAVPAIAEIEPAAAAWDSRKHRQALLNFPICDFPYRLKSIDRTVSKHTLDVNIFVDDMNNIAYNHYMSLQTEIADIEARIAALDLSMAWVLRRVGVERATWSHWKSGFRSPMKETWDRISAEVSSLERGLAK